MWRRSQSHPWRLHIKNKHVVEHPPSVLAGWTWTRRRDLFVVLLPLLLSILRLSFHRFLTTYITPLRREIFIIRARGLQPPNCVLRFLTGIDVAKHCVKMCGRVFVYDHEWACENRHVWTHGILMQTLLNGSLPAWPCQDCRPHGEHSPVLMRKKLHFWGPWV